MEIPFTVKETAGVLRSSEPVEVGLPLPPGVADGENHWAVTDETGNAIPAQFKSLATYPDGSTRAIHAVFLIDLEPGQSRTLTVVNADPWTGPKLVSEENGKFRASLRHLTLWLDSFQRSRLTLYQERGENLWA